MSCSSIRHLPGSVALLLAALLTAGCSVAVRAGTTAEPAAGEQTLVVVVRHAERAAVEGDDPPLSAAGAERARSLADAVADLGLTAIYATQRQRTQLTAQPAAARLGIPITVLPIAVAAEHAALQASEIRTRHAGGTVLVVGHSNTVPLIVRALGGPDVEAIEDHEFDHLYLVVIPGNGPVRALRARYGGPNPPP